MSSHSTIPQFPKFRLLKRRDGETIASFTKLFPPSADYNFVSLWSYDVAEDVQISQCNGNLVIKFRDYITHEPFYSFFGRRLLKETIAVLLKHAASEKITASLKLIPEYCVEPEIDKLSMCGFAVRPDRDNYDYIYRVEDLVNLSGPSFSKKRYWVNKFKKVYPAYTTRRVDLKKKGVYESILSVFSAWASSAGKTSEEVLHDLHVIERFFALVGYFDFICTFVVVNGEIVGFSIVESVWSKYAVCHFVKADRNFKGIFEIIYHEMAKELHKRDVLYLNRENDLGLKGLRQAKQSWCPIRYLKKYEISAKGH